MEKITFKYDRTQLKFSFVQTSNYGEFNGNLQIQDIECFKVNLPNKKFYVRFDISSYQTGKDIVLDKYESIERITICNDKGIVRYSGKVKTTVNYRGLSDPKVWIQNEEGSNKKVLLDTRNSQTGYITFIFK